MRKAGIVCLLVLFGCGDDGLRDRSLLGSLKSDGLVRLHRRSTRKRPSTAVIGLGDDPLAHYYADETQLVVRFESAADLTRDLAGQLQAVSKALPELGLPEGTPGALARRALGLPVDLEVDPLRPFAFVRLDGGWVGILPTRARETDGTFLKGLDAIYSVAGDPKLVAAYRAGFSKGFYLPGHCSVIARPKALPALGTALTEATRTLGLDLGFLDGVLTPVPGDIERVDLSLSFAKSTLRVDVRVSPNPQSPTALALQQMNPAHSAAARWLPTDGTLYFESLAPALQWESLVLNMLREFLPRARGEAELDLLALRRFLKALGDNTAVMVDLEPDGSGRALLVANLSDAEATGAFFRSKDLRRLLRVIAGPGGALQWTPKAFTSREIPVGSITGRIDRARLLRWRQSGNVYLASLATLLRGPVVTYVALIEDRLCLVVGQRARAEAERFIEHLRTGAPADTRHNKEVQSLFAKRLGAVTVDLAGVFEGSREAAPHWHRRGRALRNLALPARVPTSAALTIEGGALRLAVRIRPRLLAEATAAIVRRLK